MITLSVFASSYFSRGSFSVSFDRWIEISDANFLLISVEKKSSESGETTNASDASTTGKDVAFFKIPQDPHRSWVSVRTSIENQVFLVLLFTKWDHFLPCLPALGDLCYVASWFNSSNVIIKGEGNGLCWEVSVISVLFCWCVGMSSLDIPFISI